MPEGSSASRTVSKIAEKVVEILDVFDLSFFISGAVATAALLVYFEDQVTEKLIQHAGISIFGLVVASYVLGLVSFAVGRPLRPRFHRLWARLRNKGNATRANALLQRSLVAQGLAGGSADATRFASLFDYRAPANPQQLSADEEAALSHLYTRLWVHVRSFEGLQESFALLKRYWVLSASYDGMAIAVLAWLFPVWQSVLGKSGSTDGEAIALAGLWTALIIGGLMSCWHRAEEYKRYQVEELVATVAHWMSLVGKPVLRELEAPAGAQPSASAEPDA